MKGHLTWGLIVIVALSFITTSCSPSEAPSPGPGLTDEQVENLVRRSYQYVALYNVNNKFAQKIGWNMCDADTTLKDHTMREIARPNNDTLYVTCLLDLRDDAMILDVPAFDSKYVSLMITAYDHYVNVPMTTRVGDFRQSEQMVVYSARTEGYDGTPIEGVDRTFEATGDFVSAVFRVMPHASDPERFERITRQMQSVRLMPLAEFRGGTPKPATPVTFPPVGTTDADVFEHNLLDVMQFVFNHTTFDPANDLDRQVLAAYEPLGVVPGRTYEPSSVAQIDGARFRQVVERLIPVEMALATDPAFRENMARLFQPKGKMPLELLLFQSIIGPIGLPAAEAMYPAVATADGQPMNALHDYVVRMTADALPPAQAFWSVTLYDTKNGFFIPNDRKKYSVGENAGMRPSPDGGIAIYVAAEQPPGVPPENWLPVVRQDENIDLILRVYVPDLEKMTAWAPPRAEKIN
jgi:hypothetical protein